MKPKFIAFTTGLTVLVTSLAPAATLTYVVYTNTASFAEAVGRLSVYDFEAIPAETNCKTYDFGDFTVNGEALYTVDIKNENTHELCFNSSSYNQHMSVSFHNPIMAFGFDWRNTDNNSDMVRVDFAGTRYLLGAKDESGFWGVMATNGLITSDIPFQFGDTPGGSGWTRGNLDNFLYVEREVTITSIQLSETNLVLEWSANQSGLSYTVESCTNLNNASWAPIQPTSQWWTVQNAWTNTQESSQSHFFRVEAKQD